MRVAIPGEISAMAAAEVRHFLRHCFRASLHSELQRVVACRISVVPAAITFPKEESLGRNRIGKHVTNVACSGVTSRSRVHNPIIRA
jgi:hypothetical protein